MAGWWVDFPWRVVQTNMRDIDMDGLDARRFVDDLKSFHANVAMISFGGTLANYPSAIADHYLNRNMNGDTLKTLVDLCHAEGIKVVARTDFSKMHSSVYERHPEWAYRDPDGNILDSHGYISTCQNSGFQHEFLDSVVTEILKDFHVDGIYCNMGGFMIVDYHVKLHGPCHCEACTKAFREQFGMKLPQQDIPFASVSDPTVAAYQTFKEGVTAAQKQRVAALVHSIAADAAYCSVDYVRQETNTEPGRGLPHWQYSASSNSRTIRGCAMAGENASVDMLGFSARGTSISPALHEGRLWQTLANFGGLDFFIMGRLDNREDTSGFNRARKVFSFAHEHEGLFTNVKSQADVLLVRDSYHMPIAEERGWIRVLTELHIPCDEVLASCLQKVELESYKALILPDKARLKASVCSRINEYVQRGGAVVVIGKTPLEQGRPLAALGLKEVGPFVNAEGANLHLTDESRMYFPSLVDRAFIPVGKGYYPYSPDTAKGLIDLMPPQRFGPPEVCYMAEEPTGYSGVVLNCYGKGKALYIPWNVGAFYYAEGYDIWLVFLQDVLQHILALQSLSRTLSPMVEVTVGTKGDETIVQFVNGTGHFGNSFFDPVELSNQSIELPWDTSEVVCRSLFEQDNCIAMHMGEKLKVTVKKLGFYEGVVIKKLEKENTRL